MLRKGEALLLLFQFLFVHFKLKFLEFFTTDLFKGFVPSLLVFFLVLVVPLHEL